MIVETFPQLYEALQTFRGGRWVFRGVHDPAHTLIPKAGRRPIDRTEQRILEMFGRELPGYLEHVPSDQWELLAVGQHHGLPTRLLDWSENPLAAAFFACDKHYDRDGVIYAMRNPFVVKDTTESVFAITKVMRYRPRHISARIRAQQGLFSVHPQPSVPLELGKSDGIQIARILIHKGYKEQLLWDLARFGIHRAMLFPDIDGLASHIRWMYESFDPAKAPTDDTNSLNNESVNTE
jgi:hypothetical protein